MSEYAKSTGGECTGLRLALLLIVCAGWLLLPDDAWATRTAHVPDWVTQAAKTPMPTMRPRDGAAVLLDQTDITVDAQGHATVHERKVIRIVSAGGREYGVERLFYEQGAKVHYLHCWTLGADERTYQLEERDVLDVAAVPNFAVYDSTRVRVARAEAVEPDATVAFESEYVEAPFISSWEYDVDRGIPSAGQSVALTLAPGFVRHEGWAHMEPVPAKETGPSQWQWQIGPRASLDKETAAPELGEVAARMMIAYSGGAVPESDGDWAKVGQWYANLSNGVGASTPEIGAQVAQLTAGKTTFRDKLLAITGFMQDQVRYVAVEMGIGGWQPHPSAQVFAHRYGDCKDKATLLVTMLADAGITAHPLIVDFDHRVDPHMPTHYADHMITAIEIPDGVEDASLHAVLKVDGKRMLVFDPTNSASPAGSLEPELQGSYGLLLRGADSTLIQLPVLTPGDNTLVRTGQFKLATDGSLSGDLKEQRAGNTGDTLRYLCLQGDQKKVEEREARAIDSSLTDATMTGLVVEKAQDRSVPLTVSYHVAANGYAKHAGAMLLVRPSVLGMYEPRVDDASRPRLYPIDLGEESSVQEDYTIHLPAAYKADDLPDPVKLETAFASFESSVTLEGDSLHYKRELSIRTLEVPPAQAKAYRAFIAEVGNAERSEAILKPEP
jgi:hypothetical protein